MSSGTTIRVRHLNGEEYPTPISLDETIGALKEKVEASSGIAAARQRLIYKGKEVHNHVQLAAAGLSDGSVIHLVERLIAPTSEGQPGPSAGAQTQGQGGAGVFAGPGLEAVNAIVSQVVGGLLGPTTSHGSQPASPRTSNRRRRTAPPLNGLVALHGYLSRLSDLQNLDDPPAMLPVVRTGLPNSHHSWNSVTSATTAVLNSNLQRHGSLQDALIAATGDTNLSSSTVEQLDALLQRAVAQQQQQPQHDMHPEGANPTPLSGEPSRGPGVSAPVMGTSASQADGLNRPDAAPSDTYEFMQLIVLAYALTMAQAAESMRTFEASFTERAASLARDVLLDVEAGNTTFERSQVHMERLGTTANRMSGLAVEAAYLCGLFANAVRGDHRMLADGMHPVVLMTDQQHSRALQHAATVMPQAFPNGQPASAAATAGAAARPSSVDAIPRISINPGFAPMLVGSPSLRRIMPTRATTTRASNATSGGSGGSPAGTSAADDPGASAAWSLLQGILGSNADVSQVMGGLPGDPMTSPLAPNMQAGHSNGASDSGGAQDQSSVSVPAHSSEQQMQDLPIFNQDPSTSGASMASAMPGMPLTGIHISSSIVTGGLPFGNVGAPDGSAADGGTSADGTGSQARRIEGTLNPDGTTDVGGMIIQLELPQDGGSVTSIQTTGIGQLGTVLQNMMQEQLAFARERIRDQSGGDAGAGGTDGGGAASRAAARSTPGTSSANPADASARAVRASASSRGAASSTAALSLPTQVMRLTQQLVSDVRRQQALPEEERDAEAARLTREYLQQVPDMLRQALPQVAAGVNNFLQRGQAPNGTAPAGGAAPADDTARSALAAVPADAAPAASAAARTPATATAAPGPAAPTAAAAPGASAAVTKEGNSEQQTGIDPTLEAEFDEALRHASEGASTSSAAAARGSSSAGPSKPGPSLSKRPEPKGLAGGLKPRKARSAGAAAGAASGSAPAAPPAAASAMVASAPAMGPAAGGGGPGPGGSRGGGPLDMLMPLMQSPQMQQMLNSPQVQGMAEQMSSGNANLGSLMQSMMPMVSSMLGGAQDQSTSSAPGGRGARSTGAGGSQANSMPPAGSAEMKAMLVQELGPEEAARWQKVIKEDKALMQRSSRSSAERSNAYTAGSIRDAEGDRGPLF